MTPPIESKASPLPFDGARSADLSAQRPFHSAAHTGTSVSGYLEGMFSSQAWGDLPTLCGEVVLIEPFSSRDIPAMMSWNQDTEAQRWFDWPTDLPNDQHVVHCRNVIETWRTEWAAGRRAPFVVRDLGSGVAVGSVEVRSNDEGRWLVSYLTHPDWRRRGFATRAVRLAGAWAFSTLLIEELHLEVAEDNIASRMVAAGVGFIDTGHRFASEPVVSFEPEIGVTRTMIRYALRQPAPGDRSRDPAP